MSFLPFPAQNTTQAVALIKQDGALFHEMVHGDENAEVLTENGLVPSVNNVLQDLLDRIGVGTGADVTLRPDLAAVNSAVSVGGIAASHIANALRNIVTPENFGTNGDAIQLAINYCSSVGGGTVVLGAKTYTITAPILLKGFVNIIGQGHSTIIKKTTASTIGGIDAILISQESAPINQFFVENLALVGNRTNKASGNTVTTNGVYLDFAHFFTLRNVKVEDCLVGFTFKQCYVAVLEQLRAFRCQGYAFHTFGGCTTLSATNLLSWACGGGYKIHATIYSTFRDCACDYSDAGGTSTDPFLPEGSGGDYLNPVYVWDIVASRITVTGAGSENCYSKWLYGEGAFVDFVAPFVFNMKGYSSVYRAIELRGTGQSKINLSNPILDIRLDGTPSFQRRMFFVENPATQVINTDTLIVGDTSFAEFADPVNGVNLAGKNTLLEMTQTKMVVGQSNPFIYTPADILLSTTISGTSKRFNVLNQQTTARSVRFPLEYKGALEVVAKGTHTSSVGTLTIRVVGWDGTNTDIVKSFSLTGAIDFRGYTFLNQSTPLTTKPLFLEIIAPSSTDNTYFTEFVINQIL